MQKAHGNINWENYPSDKTPVNERNLNAMDVSIDAIDDRVITLDTTKFNVSDAQTLIKNITFNLQTGILTKYYYNGSTEEINTGISKLNMNLRFDRESQTLYIVNADGTEDPIDLSSFITNNEFADSDTIAHNVSASGTVTSIVKEGSIQEKHLQPNYLADIRVEAAKAQQSATQASGSAVSAADSAILSKSWAIGGTGTRAGEDTDNSKYYSEQSKNSSNAAKETLKDVEKAGNDAVDKINNAFEVIAPTFQIDFATGNLLYDAESFGYIFLINTNTGNLEWGLSV